MSKNIYNYEFKITIPATNGYPSKTVNVVVSELELQNGEPEVIAILGDLAKELQNYVLEVNKGNYEVEFVDKIQIKD